MVSAITVVTRMSLSCAAAVNNIDCADANKGDVMQLAEARSYIGKVCRIRFHDRSGQEHEVSSLVYDATYVPLYGGYFVTDMDDVRLDRVISVGLVGENAEMIGIHGECVAA